jgi:hypothetical protein
MIKSEQFIAKFGDVIKGTLVTAVEYEELQQKDAELAGEINAEATARAAADGTLDDKITQEATDRQEAVSNEASARVAADATLGGQITQEATDRQEAVSNEASARVAADATLGGQITQEATARADADAALGLRIDAMDGRGGPLTAHDFGTATPTMEALLEYACTDIWGAGGVFNYDSDTPYNSTYVIGGETHTMAGVFNGTWVVNTYSGLNEEWQLVSTPDTTPPIFVWVNTGPRSVAQATPETAGVARLYNTTDGQNQDGAVTQAAIEAALGNKVDKVDGKGLSTLDVTQEMLDAKVNTNGTDRLMTETEGEKLGGIEEEAQVNPAIATQEEAVAGTDDTKMMTPQKTKQAIAAGGGGGEVVVTKGWNPEMTRVKSAPFQIRLNASGAQLLAGLRVGGVDTTIQVASLGSLAYAAPILTNVTAIFSNGTTEVTWASPSNYIHHFELTVNGVTTTIAGNARSYTSTEMPFGSVFTLRLVDDVGEEVSVNGTVIDYTTPTASNLVAMRVGTGNTEGNWTAAGSIGLFKLYVNNTFINDIAASARTFSLPSSTAPVGAAIKLEVYDVNNVLSVTLTATVTQFNTPTIGSFSATNYSGSTTMIEWTVTNDSSIDSFELDTSL